MAQVYRRIILIPPDSSEAARAELENNLRAAYELQRKLSRETPHVLRPFGAPTLENGIFQFDHEPAAPIEFKYFFDRDDTGISTEELLSAAFALVEALRAAHAASDGAIAHGGLTPGVLLRTKEGIWKVSDFRIAPSFCETLGIQHYLNLAIGPRKSEQAGVIITGAWEVLPEHEYERDDRICAFIDPEKYAAVLDHGENVLATFEPGSDVIAAGNLIALLAQRIHPFLSDVPEAHRIVEMSRMMASAVALPLQREDLLTAGEPETKAFVGLLIKMLERQPKNRPRAADVASVLSPSQTLKRDYAAIARSQDEREAEHWLATLEPLLERGEWLSLDVVLNEPPQIKTWPDGVTQRAEEIRRKFQEFGDAEKRQAQMEADATAANQWFVPFRDSVQNRNWDEGKALLQKKPKLIYWPDEIAKELDALEKSLQLELKKADDFAIARKWFAEITQLLDRENWFSAEECLNKKPLLQFWPDDVSKPIEEIRQDLGKKLGAVHSSHQKAKQWLEQARQALRIKAYAQAIEILGEKPDLPHWPDGILDEAGKLIDECAERIGDDAALKLQLRDESLQRAARVFLKAVIEKDMAGLLDSGVIRLLIDGDQVSIEEGMDRGHAILVLSLPGDASTPENPDLRIPFEYDLSQKAGAVRDADSQVRKKIVSGLAAGLLRRQAIGPQEINAKLKKSLFPNASLEIQIKKPSREATAKARLDPNDKEAIDVRLTWDSQRLAWFLAESAELNKQISTRARASAREAAMAHCLQNAASLAPYASGLEMEIDAPAIESNAMTATAPFVARLVLSHPTDRRRFLLQEMKGELSAGGRIDLFGNWSGAIKTLDEFVVAEQSNRRDAAVETLSAFASKDGIKAKIIVTPKRIKSPTEEISIELKIKGAENQLQIGKWNASRFDFDFLSGFKPQATSAPVAPAAPPGKAPAPSTAAPAKKTMPADAREPKKTPSPEKATEQTQQKSKRGMFIGGGVAAVVLIGALIGFSMSGGGGKNDVPQTRPEPPTSLAIDPLSMFEASDPEFTSSFRQLAEKLEGIKSEAANVDLSTPWQEETQDTVVHTASLRLGNSPFDARITLTFDPVKREWGSPQWEFQDQPPLAQIAGWLRSNAARQIQALSKEDKQAAAEKLHADLSPIFESFKRRGLCESLEPLEATIATEVPRDSPVTAAEYPISEVLGRENAGLAKLIQAVVKPGKSEMLMLRPDFIGDSWDISQPDASSRLASIKIGEFADLSVKCTFAYDEPTSTYAGTPIWSLETPVPEQLSLAQALIADGERRITSLSTSGKLNLARGQFEQLSAALTQIRANSAFVELPTLQIGVPDAWINTRPAGYSAVDSAGTDEQTGYPKQIAKDADGRLMLLIAIAPTDSFWDNLGTAKENRDWFIMYVDANEWAIDREPSESAKAGTPYNDFQSAESAAKGSNVAIPTLQQWRIAALYLDSNAVGQAANLFDGLYEWCSDPVADSDTAQSRHWVTGGCFISSNQNLPAAPPTGDFNARLNWLKSPLITQTRFHGDDLVGLRTVLPIYPAAQGE